MSSYDYLYSHRPDDSVAVSDGSVSDEATSFSDAARSDTRLRCFRSEQMFGGIEIMSIDIKVHRTTSIKLSINIDRPFV